MTERRRRKFWGWGYEEAALDEAAQRKIAEGLAARFGLDQLEISPAPRIEEIQLREPRFRPPAALASSFTADPAERARHSYGSSFRDVVRAYRRDFSEPPDWVALPPDEAGVTAVLDWCSSERIAVIPYGGGSSVVGGVECAVGDGYAGVVSLDLGRLDRVLEIDRASRAARIQAGIFGPPLEDALRPHGLTLRHFPQSFEFSSLGGWLATRSGGHYATLYTHIEDFLESMRVVTPTGTIESRRLPGSGAGPSPDRLFVGSEGTLGVITEAWMRLQDRPVYRANASAAFERFEDGVAATRALSQSGLYPTNCRLLDPGEAAISGASQEGKTVLVVAFESVDHELDAWMARALEIVRDCDGRVPEGAGRTRTDAGASREGAAGAWRSAFLSAPYLRDALVGMGLITETFETSITWERFEAFHAAVLGAALWTGDRELSLHARVSGRARALLHDPRAGAKGGPARAVGGDQGRLQRGGPRAGGHDHPPSLGGARSPPLVRATAAGRLRARAPRVEGGARPGRDPQPGRPDRPLTLAPADTGDGRA
jgi:alkyldihydroxyacetonephosphate synthase